MKLNHKSIKVTLIIILPIIIWISFLFYKTNLDDSVASAISSCDTSYLSELLEKPFADVFVSKESRGPVPMSDAVQSGYSSYTLVLSDDDRDIPDSLRLATYKFLLDREEFPMSKEDVHGHIFSIALMNRGAQFLKLFLSYFEKPPNFDDPEQPPEIYGFDYILRLCMERHKAEIIKILVEVYDYKVPNNEIDNILFKAIQYCGVDIIKLLVDHGADIKVVPKTTIRFDDKKYIRSYIKEAKYPEVLLFLAKNGVPTLCLKKGLNGLPDCPTALDYALLKSRRASSVDELRKNFIMTYEEDKNIKARWDRVIEELKTMDFPEPLLYVENSF